MLAWSGETLALTGAQRRWLQRLWPAAAFQLAFVASVALLKSASNAVVLARFTPRVLPLLYVAAAALTAVLTAWGGSERRRRRFGPSTLAMGGAAAIAVLAGATWLRMRGVSLLLYLFAEVYATYLAIVFWSALSRAFDAREARSAFTWTSGIGMAGGIAGGWLARTLAGPFGTAGILLAAALALVGAAAAFRPKFAPQALPEVGKRAASAEVFQYVRTHRHVQALAGLVVAFSVLSAVVDYLFRYRAAEVLDEAAMAGFFGSFQLTVGLVCVVFQLGFAGPLLRRLGIVRYLMVVPGALCVLSLATLVSPALGPAFALKVVEGAASLSIYPVTLQLLYAPLPDALRDGVRGAMDGVVKKGGLAVGGALLLLAGGKLARPGLELTVLGLALVAVAVVLRLRKTYVFTLREQVAGNTESGEWKGVASQPALAAALASPKPERVFYALELMAQAELDVRSHLPKLLKHPDVRVLERAAKLVRELQAKECAGELEALLRLDRRRPRMEAAWSLAQVAPERGVALLPALLDDKDPGMRCAAVGALIRSGHGDLCQGQLEALLTRGSEAPVAERREVARLLGRLGDEAHAPALHPYLQDPDPSVRALAIAAAGEGGYHSLAGRLLPFLTWRDERRAAREALTRMGDTVTELLEQALNDRQRPLSLRYQIPRVLRHIGSQRALEALLFSNVQDDAFLHYRIGVALSALREEQPELLVDAAWVREALRRRYAVYKRFVGAFRDLKAGLGEGSLLTRAVGDRLDQAYELSFWLLGLLHDPRDMRRIHAHLVGQDGRRRAYALELLETQLSSEEAELMLAQVEAHHRELPPGAPARVDAHLKTLCVSDDHVLRACARHVARKRGSWNEAPREDDMALAILDKLFALEGVDIFTQSDVDDVAAVAAVAREQSYRKGERIYAEGDPGDALYVIVRGVVEAYRGGEHVLTLREKEAFGEVSLLDGSPRPTEMIAAEDVTTLLIDRRDFLDLLSDRPELFAGIFRVVSGQLKRVLDFPRRTTGEVPSVAGEGSGSPSKR